SPGTCPAGLTLLRPNLLPNLPAYNANGSANNATYFPFGGGTTWFVGAANTVGVLSFLVTDANQTALNPVAQGSTVTATGTTGLTVAVVGGSPVPNTLYPSGVSISYSFGAPVTSGTVTVTIASPRGLQSTFSQAIQAADFPTTGYTACP
ncbi:MAG: hypothetical protein KGL43_03585, partial [Burkholderiales bacterium]|nr:hypothetical protein [Burkholderiales bacterium]